MDSVDISPHLVVVDVKVLVLVVKHLAILDLSLNCEHTATCMRVNCRPARVKCGAVTARRHKFRCSRGTLCEARERLALMLWDRYCCTPATENSEAGTASLLDSTAATAGPSRETCTRPTVGHFRILVLTLLIKLDICV